MTGKVKLLKTAPSVNIYFADMVAGDGTVSSDGTRIKLRNNVYLHFAASGVLSCNEAGSWPPGEITEIKKFRLIAEEI